MSIKLRFSLLLGLLLAGLLLVLVLQQRWVTGATAGLLAASRQTRAQLLDHWIDFSSRALPQFTADTAQAEEFGRLLAHPDPEEIRRKLAGLLRAAGLDALWVFRDDGTVAQAAVAGPDPAAPPPPLAPLEVVALVRETPAPRCFAPAGPELLEVCIRRIHGTVPSGAAWLAVARRWDAGHLRGLAALADARVALRPPHEALSAPADATTVVLQRPLRDWQGHPLRTLLVEAGEPEVALSLRGDGRQAGLFLAFGLGLIAATALALHQWIVRPLGRISTGLASHDPTPLLSLEHDRSELGQMARLAIESFAQRRTLQAEIEQRAQAQAALERSEAELRRNLQERARIGRDLHDGVIQSLYAAGMGLAGIRPLLQADQLEAAARIEQTRADLNETIHDVRNFILGLEPEALKLQTFSQAIAALLEVMRSHRDFLSQLHIDENVARRLTLAQRVHALQITREAVSNALRHGAASRITVALRRPGEFVEFEILDDGAGFDAAAGASLGTGLANFQQRAKELGAELTVRSEAGRGTRVRLVFPLGLL